MISKSITKTVTISSIRSWSLTKRIRSTHNDVDKLWIVSFNVSNAPLFSSYNRSIARRKLTKSTVVWSGSSGLSELSLLSSSLSKSPSSVRKSSFFKFFKSFGAFSNMASIWALGIFWKLRHIDSRDEKQLPNFRINGAYDFVSLQSSSNLLRVSSSIDDTFEFCSSVRWKGTSWLDFDVCGKSRPRRERGVLVLESKWGKKLVKLSTKFERNGTFSVNHSHIYSKTLNTNFGNYAGENSASS